MKSRETNKRREVKESRFPASLFAIYLGVLFLMSGIHTGLIVFMNKAGWNGLLQSGVPMAYWVLVAVGLTLFTRKKIKDTYEEPLHKLAAATDQVANGDFSVYVPAIHTQDKWDYLDVMIMDFNKMVEELGSIEMLKTDFVSNVSHGMKTPAVRAYNRRTEKRVRIKHRRSGKKAFRSGWQYTEAEQAGKSVDHSGSRIL